MPLSRLKFTAAPSLLALSLWRTLRLLLATYPTEPTQVWLALWSIVWGIWVGNPLTDTFSIAPHAYAWMRPVPEWVWGVVWVIKGVWQGAVVLSLIRAKTFLSDGATAAKQCFWAARLNVTLSTALAVGFAWHMGAFNLFVAFYVYQAIQHGWVLMRAASDAPFGTKELKTEGMKTGAIGDSHAHS